MLKVAIRSMARKAGFDVIRYARGGSTGDGRRLMLMRNRHIDLLIDVGANAGQYARGVRKQGYPGRIISFEPLPEAFGSLARAAERDSAWDCYQCALGPTDSVATLNVASNSVSSSLLPMLKRHIDAAPWSGYCQSVDVEVHPLDSFVERLRIPQHHVYLKLDVQGYELQVLEGAVGTLEFVDLLELELSLVPLYEGQLLFWETVGLMKQQCFELVSVEPVFTDPQTGHLLQLDGIFERHSSPRA
jgi:FkbM family methyltransferase